MAQQNAPKWCILKSQAIYLNKSLAILVYGKIVF
jgi:hypothetical protein